MSVRQFLDLDLQVCSPAEFQQVTINVIKWRHIDVSQEVNDRITENHKHITVTYFFVMRKWHRISENHKPITVMYFFVMRKWHILQYWHERADERHGNPPQGNKELIVVRRPPRWAWGKQVYGMWYFFPSVLWLCWLGDRKGIRPVKKLDVGLLVVMILLELCTTYSSSCHHHLHHPLLQ